MYGNQFLLTVRQGYHTIENWLGKMEGMRNKSNPIPTFAFNRNVRGSTSLLFSTSRVILSVYVYIGTQ
jgi:hypothetical protein